MDTTLLVEDGMQPVMVTVPHVRNFNSQLNSGAVVVRTIYDGVILDESGTTETNRKALTGLPAYNLKFTGFTFYPKNMGQAATY